MVYVKAYNISLHHYLIINKISFYKDRRNGQTFLIYSRNKPITKREYKRFYLFKNEEGEHLLLHRLFEDGLGSFLNIDNFRMETISIENLTYINENSSKLMFKNALYKDNKDSISFTKRNSITMITFSKSVIYSRNIYNIELKSFKKGNVLIRI